jgi:hypothetical protein
MSEATHHPLAAVTHIGLILEQIRRQAGMAPETLAHRTGTDLAHIVGVLSGDRFPSRLFTVRYAQACGADHQILLKVWEDERERLDPNTRDGGQGAAGAAPKTGHVR